MKKLLPILLIFYSLLGMACARTSSDSGNITFSTRAYSNPASNPKPSKEVVGIVTKALYRLADDPKLAKHPVHSYLYEPNMQANIIFDNPGTIDGSKVVNYNEIHINSQKDYAHYLVALAHEFIHVGIMEKYGNTANYSFLAPEDYAFLNLMEEAFASIIGLWVHLSYPEVPSNEEVRMWRMQTDYTRIAEAMRNDFLVLYPEHESGQIIEEVVAELFNMFMTSIGTYTIAEIPRNMAIVYSRRNTCLIPEYETYSSESDALLRHIWNSLADMVPFKLPEYLSYDHYRSQFLVYVIAWAAAAPKFEDSILYWINFDAKDAAMTRLAAIPENERVYDYLPGEDEERLGGIMREIGLAAAYAQGGGFDSGSEASSTIVSENVVFYTEESAAKQFSEDADWSMPDLLQHEIYLLDNEINADFWFRKSAGFNQIDRARSFTIRTFVLRLPYSIGKQPYSRLSRNLNIRWKTSSCRIFLDGELLHHDLYDEHYRPINPLYAKAEL